MMNSQYLKKVRLPNSPGVYIFLGPPKRSDGGKDRKKILYIGKATSLRDRVKSYFGNDLISTRGPLLVDMVTKASTIEFIRTDSVLEALILEASLIKKHQPKYNTKEKDNKSFNYVCITKDEWPKVLVVRGRGIVLAKYKYVFGPFPNGLQLREAMRIIRRIFPYIDMQSSKKDNREFYNQLSLNPNGGLQEYKKNINNLRLFFQGKKKNILANLKKEMNAFARASKFEQAALVRNKIFALNHINDMSLIKEEALDTKPTEWRVEAYDIAHMSGQNMVGVMTVVASGEAEKGEYKKFIIRTQKGANDTGALEEVLSRRFRHTEWGLPALVVVDGSTAQLNVAKQVLNRYQFSIPIVGVVKDTKHKPKAIIGDAKIIKQNKKGILLANSEAHRFAIKFHKEKRSKNFLK